MLRSMKTEAELEEKRGKERERRKLLKEAGLCYRCGKNPNGPYGACGECLKGGRRRVGEVSVG